MPEYLAPGVYVEEVSFRSKSIEGVSTTTTGFIGPARYGPIDLVPDVLTSLADFEATYGDRQQLVFEDDPPTHNYLWHAARAFFEEGGKRLYCVRVFTPLPEQDGHAHATIASSAGDIRIRTRFPGAAGTNMLVRFTLQMKQNVLTGVPDLPRISALRDNDIVWVGQEGSPGVTGSFYQAEHYYDPKAKSWSWRFYRAAASPLELPLELTTLDPGKDAVHVVTLTVTVVPSERNSLSRVWGDLPLDPQHQLDGFPDAFPALFSENPTNLNAARTLPVVITPVKILSPGTEDVLSGLEVLRVLFDAHDGLYNALADLASSDAQVRKGSTDLARSVEVQLKGGNDGQRPDAGVYEGTAEEDKNVKTGLMAFEDIDDISIIAAPGSTFGYESNPHIRDNANTIINLLISHAERMRYRIAVLDSGDGQSIASVRAMRGKFDSSYAALYYPWIRVLDPVTRTEISLPPSGFVAGIYARNDINRAVYKAPANEVVTLALGFEVLLNKSQQEVLNPEGINCFRFFEGRGFRLWGARTASSDPEWKYVNLRRYFAYLEHSIDKGTQWAVFEPNGEALWANVRRTIEDFLLNEWQMGALLGDKPEKAYFVRCDRSTMTQNDLDNCRLVCLIGVAPLRPAEFVIFRIGQWTGDSKA